MELAGKQRHGLHWSHGDATERAGANESTYLAKGPACSACPPWRAKAFGVGSSDWLDDESQVSRDKSGRKTLDNDIGHEVADDSVRQSPAPE